MQKFNDGFQISHLVWEKLYHSLVSPNLAEPVYYLKKLRDILGDSIVLRFDLLFDVMLKEPHDRGNKLVQNRVQDG